MSQSLDLKNILRTQKGPDGRSLFEHICDTLEDAYFNKQQDKYSTFESQSGFIKRNNYNHKIPKESEEVNRQKDYSNEMTEYNKNCEKLLQQTALEDSKGNRTDVKSLGALANLKQHHKILERAGISFGEDETYLLYKSLKNLAATTQAKELRFWGKILGSEEDYWVAEGLLDINQPSDDPPTKDTEPQGAGCNRLTFWVTNNVLDDWYQLPLITPEQVNAARVIKHTFTGNLDASVNTYPEFPGKEKHYLKAQLVRITFSCALVPDNIRQTDEEDEKIEELKFVEDAKYPDWDTVTQKDNWVHLHQNILNSGRVRHYVPDSVPEDDRQGKDDELAENDPYVPRLQKIVEDRLPEKYTEDFNKFKFFKNFKKAPEDGEEKPVAEWEDREIWTSKICGDKQAYQLKGDEGQAAYAVAVFKNILWPGSATVASMNDYVNVYCGYGHKLNTVTVNPDIPNFTQDDPFDPDEQPEPQPKDGPPKEEKPDSQAGDNPDGDDNAGSDAD